MSVENPIKDGFNGEPIFPCHVAAGKKEKAAKGGYVDFPCDK